MKYLLAFLLSTTSLLALDPRPMTMTIINEAGFSYGFVTAPQAPNEGIIFEWTDNFVNWQLLADISPYTQHQYWSVSVPTNWYTGSFFVRTRGYFAQERNALAAQHKRPQYILAHPANKIENLTKAEYLRRIAKKPPQMPPMPPLPPGFVFPSKPSPVNKLKLLFKTKPTLNRQNKKGAELLVSK